jgi:capsid protein
MGSLLGAIGRVLGIGRAAPIVQHNAGRPLRARYDAAQTASENSRRWALTDLLSAAAANSKPVRQKLCSRMGYCLDNNSYAAGIVETKVKDLIGTGPTPKVKIRTMPDEACGQVEAAFMAWWRAVKGLEKLKTIAKAKVGRTGEGFLILQNYDRVADPVKLYPRDIEADQCTTPNAGIDNRTWIDGVNIDRLGNAVSYDVLKQHPGDLFFAHLNPQDYDTIDARYVIHWFRKNRPGQLRGIPEMTPALELFEQMRTYRMATLSAAEHAALFSLYLESTAPADSATNDPAPFTGQDIERGMFIEGPAGFKPYQLKPENPQSTYQMFVYCLLAEACRCIGMPFIIALGSAHEANFSSARSDFLNYRDGLVVDREDCEDVVLDRIFFAWLTEAILVSRAGGAADGLMPTGLDIADVSVDWHWPGWAMLDPLKDAQSDTERLGNNTLTYEQYFAEQGKDWDVQFRQLAKEKALRDKLGLSPVAPPTKPQPGQEDSNAQNQAQARAA